MFSDGPTLADFAKYVSLAISHWWREKRIAERDDADTRRPSSVELSGVLPDGTKFAVKEYAKDANEAYRIALDVASKARGDFVK